MLLNGNASRFAFFLYLGVGMSLRNEVLRSALGSKTASGTDMKPPRQFAGDTVTPYKICLLVLIREFLVSIGPFVFDVNQHCTIN